MSLRKGCPGRTGTQLGRTYTCPVWHVPSVQDTAYSTPECSSSIHLTSLLQTAYDYSTSHGASVFPLPSLQPSYAGIGKIPAGPLPAEIVPLCCLYWVPSLGFTFVVQNMSVALLRLVRHPPISKNCVSVLSQMLLSCSARTFPRSCKASTRVFLPPRLETNGRGHKADRPRVNLREHRVHGYHRTP